MMSIRDPVSTLLSLRSNPSEFSESNGYYERVPIRVGEFVLEKNEEGLVVFKTSSQKHCRKGPMITVRISNSGNGWSVKESQGPYHCGIAPSVDLHRGRLERRRAFWHAAQRMAGRELSHRERFSMVHRGYNDDADLFEDDAFFKNGDAVTTDPFGEFLE